MIPDSQKLGNAVCIALNKVGACDSTVQDWCVRDITNEFYFEPLAYRIQLLKALIGKKVISVEVENNLNEVSNPDGTILTVKVITE